MRPDYPFKSLIHPMVLAHRGDSVNAPANTIVAFRRAIQAGADVLELDVHWTKDGVVVVSHDEIVDHMSDGSGAIKDLTLDELSKLDFGFRFTEDGGKTYPYRGTGVKIATLNEVLEQFPTTRINMDIKPRQYGSLKQLIIDLEEQEALSRVVIASFHHDTLCAVRQANPQIATSASPIEVAAFRFGWNRKATPAFCVVQVPAKVGRMHVVTESLIANAHRRNIEVHVWTIDDEVDMARLFELGVDGIVTNQPGRAIGARNRFLNTRKLDSGKRGWR